MLEFSEDDIATAFPIKDEPDLNAATGPVWVTFDNSSESCTGEEDTLTDCYVSRHM